MKINEQWNSSNGKNVKFTIELEDIEERAKSIEQITEKMHGEVQGKEQKEDLGYFV